MKRYVGGGIKDERGIFLPPSGTKENTPPNIPDPGSLDEIGEMIILALARAVKNLLVNIRSMEKVDRDSVGALKDCEVIYRELSKREKEFLANLSDEDLEKLANTQFKHDST